MTFPERLSKLIKEKHINKNQLQKELNLNKSSILNWTQRGNVPSGDTLSLLANYFNVSVDYLLGNSDIKKVPIRKDEDSAVMDKRAAEIKRFMDQMDDEQLTAFYAVYRAMYGRHER